jgi:hypothetical protein
MPGYAGAKTKAAFCSTEPVRTVERVEECRWSFQGCQVSAQFNLRCLLGIASCCDDGRGTNAKIEKRFPGFGRNSAAKSLRCSGGYHRHIGKRFMDDAATCGRWFSALRRPVVTTIGGDVAPNHEMRHPILQLEHVALALMSEDLAIERNTRPHMALVQYEVCRCMQRIAFACSAGHGSSPAAPCWYPHA